MTCDGRLDSDGSTSFSGYHESKAADDLDHSTDSSRHSSTVSAGNGSEEAVVFSQGEQLKVSSTEAGDERPIGKTEGERTTCIPPKGAALRVVPEGGPGESGDGPVEDGVDTSDFLSGTPGDEVTGERSCSSHEQPAENSALDTDASKQCDSLAKSEPEFSERAQGQFQSENAAMTVSSLSTGHGMTSSGDDSFSPAPLKTNETRNMTAMSYDALKENAREGKGQGNSEDTKDKNEVGKQALQAGDRESSLGVHSPDTQTSAALPADNIAHDVVGDLPLCNNIPRLEVSPVHNSPSPHPPPSLTLTSPYPPPSQTSPSPGPQMLTSSQPQPAQVAAPAGRKKSRKAARPQKQPIRSQLVLDQDFLPDSTDTDPQTGEPRVSNFDENGNESATVDKTQPRDAVDTATACADSVCFDKSLEPSDNQTVPSGTSDIISDRDETDSKRDQRKPEVGTRSGSESSGECKLLVDFAHNTMQELLGIYGLEEADASGLKLNRLKTCFRADTEAQIPTEAAPSSADQSRVSPAQTELQKVMARKDVLAGARSSRPFRKNVYTSLAHHAVETGELWECVCVGGGGRDWG